jgi:DNA-binding transcriptional MerR regulator
VDGQVISMPPRGHYLAHEVGQLAGVSGNTIGQWAHYGYIRASQSNDGDYPRVYSFQDVAEAIIVHELVDKNVPLPVVRPVIESLRDEFGDWPLQRAQLETVTAADIQIAALLVRERDIRRELGPHAGHWWSKRQ